ncbi:MAG: transcription-repair coupling factor [Chloroflexi bacterium]|nr:transcription-repair coupling factor [Chloroflexota bacterium]
MNLSGLLPLLDDVATFHRLVDTVEGGNNASVHLLEAARPYVVACLWRRLQCPLLIVARRWDKARYWVEELSAWCGDEVLVHWFPNPEALPYERLPLDPSVVHQRLKVLHALYQTRSQNPPPLIVTSPRGLAHKTLSAADFSAACHTLQTGDSIDRDQLYAKWLDMGYEGVATVEVPGTAARRGGILDIYPPHVHLPLRVEMVGNTVESLRLFDPATQRSVNLVSQATVGPAREMLLPFKNKHRHDWPSLSHNGGSWPKLEEEIEKLISGQVFEGMDFYAPLFHQGSLLEHLPNQTLLVLEEPEDIHSLIDELDNQAQEQRQSQGLPEDFPRPYFQWSELEKIIAQKQRRITLKEWDTEKETEEHTLGFTVPPSYGGRLEALLQSTIRRNGEGRLIILSHQASRLSELLREQENAIFPQEEVSQPPPPDSVTLIRGSLGAGWRLRGQEGSPALTLLTDTEVFGWAKEGRRSRRLSPHRLPLPHLSVGDYVVHVDHGIARYGGIIHMSRDSVERDYIILEYAEGDRLYVPSEQVDRIGPYIGSGSEPPSLSRLGTQEWARLRQRVRRAVAELAQELLATQATREVMEGIAFSPDSQWQQELEASFPYVETSDQLQAVQDVKQDMEQPKPMDRLVCGDVGYGKTEVALRAAFKAVSHGAQVAILVPTTVLAQQHYNTFAQRLKACPVQVEMLRRFRSEAEQQTVLGGLREGTVDICIGTHRLIQKDVEFKNLGLVIIDEEQRFGVAHKERLKQIRREVDVLTLTATPIPRTLYISLAGVRDMSVMETPPDERLPIKTYVGTYSERLVREAILREMDRNGQVFFVHNRVQNIGWMTNQLRELVPEAKLAIAHGQLPEEELEGVMLKFLPGNIDVLVCTTIIESGLDLPNVNTLIINEADRLGLSQLYQLRGRVGRGANRAYAYFLFRPQKRLTEAAEKRLRTIFQATELGAGFHIAMKDLEIRGAGNLLGPEQSGHMETVGFDLYSRMLAEAVADLKAGQAGAPKVEERLLPSIDLPLPAYIPTDYIPDENTRLDFYRRMAAIASVEKGEDMAQELRDRFGQLPEPVANLLYILRLRVLATAAQLHSLSTEGNLLVLKGERELNRRLESMPKDGLTVGHRQVRLDMKRLRKRWPEVLQRVVEALA